MDIEKKVHEFVVDRKRLSGRESFASDPFWKGLVRVGTELWFDSGDMEGIAGLWTAEFRALTTNNTLLNKEVQKGTYDEVIPKAATLLRDLPEEERVLEIAFILNARHALKLVDAFGARVSVELHTAVAHDVEATLRYARRYHRIEPEKFIVKVPLTAEGLLATRRLREEGLPINFTLGFSARQNYLAGSFAFPNFVNVFLGRANSYVADNHLGSGAYIGEKATLASQRILEEAMKVSGRSTRQIAASMRSGEQVRDLAGVDVMTMPLQVGRDARQNLKGSFQFQRERDYAVELSVEPATEGITSLWEVTEADRALVKAMAATPPSSAAELAELAREQGVGALFPEMSAEDLQNIAEDGKIPRHERWRERVRRGELAADSLLNLAGLAHFAADQKQLDDRIRRLSQG